MSANLGDEFLQVLAGGAPKKAPKKAKPRKAAALADWRSDLILKNEDPESDVQPCEHNAMVILRNCHADAGIAFDTFLDRPVYRGRPVSDEDETAITAKIQRQESVAGFSVGMVRRALRLIAKENPTDALVAHVNALPLHDGVARLDTWLARYAAANDASYTRRVSRKFVVQMIARALQPGAKADVVLVLTGAQGARKSSMVEALTCRSEFFADEVADLGNKEAAMGLAGKWLIELAEFDLGKRAPVDRLKAFLSRRSDHFVRKFENSPVDIPRRCVFVATTNDREFLSDTTGNRRFWPVEVGAQIDLEGIRRDAPQILAEALAAYRAGEPWWMDTAEEADAQEAQESHRMAHAWESLVLPWLDEAWPMNHPVEAHKGKLRTETGVTPAEVLLDCLGMRVADFEKQGVQNKVARLLSMAKWVKRRPRKSGERSYRYFPNVVLLGPPVLLREDPTRTTESSMIPIAGPSGPTGPTSFLNNTHAHAHAGTAIDDPTRTTRTTRTQQRNDSALSRPDYVEEPDLPDASRTTQAGVCPHCGRRHGAEVGCDGSPTGAK